MGFELFMEMMAALHELPSNTRSRLNEEDHLLRSSSGLHSHTCDNCGNRWEHGEDNAGSQLAHTCGRCGAEQYRRDRRWP